MSVTLKKFEKNIT